MSKRAILFMMGLLAWVGSYAQRDTKTDRSPTDISKQAFAYTDQKPQPTFNFQDYITKNLRYPELAMKNRTEGQVIVKFVINVRGGVEQVSVLKGIGSGCDEEALRLIKGMPLWVPGKQQGNAVAAGLTIPVNFELPEEESPQKGISVSWENGLKIRFSF